MKKFVLVAALVLFATQSFATIVGTQHDLASPNAVGGGTNTEVCVYCHTPHGADTSVSKAPLWNRSTTNATGGLYVGLDLNAATITNNMDLTSINGTDAPLCLSCHNGNVGDALNNPPNNGTIDLSGYSLTATANLTDDMSNDHPIGFSYGEVVAVDNEFNSTSVATTAGAAFFDNGVITDEVWCSSCHDVHDNTNAPFLRIDNAASALCLACHDK